MAISAASSNRAVFLCLMQSLAGVIFGWSNAEGSGLFNMPSYQRRFGEVCAGGDYCISTTRQSAITGLLATGATIGAVGSGFIADKFGPKKTCIAMIMVYLVGAAIETSAQNTYAQILVGRLLTGLGVGATSGLVPVIQAEQCPPRFRGFVTGSFQMAVTLGIWGVSMCSWQMQMRDGDISWRITTSLQMVWAALLLVVFVLSPESPRFLGKIGQWEKSRRNLANLRGLPYDSEAITMEMVEVEEAVQADQEMGQVSYAECFSPKDRILWRTMIGIFVQIGQQITGINFFFSYGVQFAETAGLDDTYIFQIIITSVNVIMSIPGLLAVDRFGRRPVLLWGAAIMFIGQIITGAVSVARPGDADAGKVLIAFSCLFVAGFASTWGPVAWVVCAESFPTRLSGLCATLGAGANWLFNLIIAFAAPQIQARIGSSITFVWAGCLMCNFVFAALCIPETKGLSIDEVDALYQAHVPAWRSSAFRTSQEKDINAAKLKHSKPETIEGRRFKSHEETPDSSRPSSP